MLRSLKELVRGVVWDAGLSVTKIHMGVYSEDNRLLQAVTQVCLAQALYICMPLTSRNRQGLAHIQKFRLQSVMQSPK